MTDRTRPDHTALYRLRRTIAAGTVHDLPPHHHGVLPSQEGARPRRPATFGRAWDDEAAAAGYGTADRDAPSPDPDDHEPERVPTPDSAAVLRELRERRPITLDGPPLRIGIGSGLASTTVLRVERGGDQPHCQDPACPDFGDPDFGEGTCPESHADRPDPERSATYLLAYLLAQYERVIGIHAQVRMDTDEDRRLHADAVAAMREAAAPVARFLARVAPPQAAPQPAEPAPALDDGDEPDDGGPFRPRWPLLVSEDTKREMLAALAEVVHAPNRPTGSDGAFGRGYEMGMATVLVSLGINEAAFPERKSLPRPDDAPDHPATPEPAPEPR